MLSSQAALTEGFKILLQNDRSQSAEMVLAKGETTGGPQNVHDESDQWLFVVEGEGEAVVDGGEQVLRRHSLILIERGEAHEIRNTGAGPLKTINLYVPPEY